MNKYLEKDIQEVVADKNIPWERFRNTTILITGATGMLPIYMLWTLIYLNEYKKFNITIYALVRNKERAEKVLGEYCSEDYLHILVQDVAEPICLEEPIHYIIHAASQASPKFYSTDPVGTINANVLGTIHTLNLARKQADFRGYLFYSSGEIYGIVPPNINPFTETDYGYIDLLNVRSCYAESKRMGEQLCVAYNRQYGVPAYMLRIFHSYGPYMKLDDRRVFADFVNNIVHNEDIILKTSGTAKRMFCYITDAVRAYFLVLLKGEVASAYNIANPQAFVSMRQLADTLVSIFPERGLHVRIEPDANDYVTTQMKSPIDVTIPDCSRIFGLGWTPNVSITEGFKRTILSIENFNNQ